MRSARHTPTSASSPSRAPGPASLATPVPPQRARPVLVFIDADCRAETGWLQAAVDAVAGDVAHAVVGGDVRIDFVDPKRLTGIEAYEAVFAYRQKLYIESRRFSGTGNLAMGAPVLAAVGPFAGIETAEDIDWGERATAAGFPARYVAAMRIYHPGRTDFAQLQRKWARHIAHFHHAHVAAGKSAARWYALALATLVSSLWHAPRILTSNQLSGIGNRWRGIKVLLRIRFWRCAEMLRAAAGRNRGASAWNPAA